jgi:hypothetical protein
MNIGNEIFCVAEAGRWNPLVLLVMERYALTQARIDFCSGLTARDRKKELLRHGARDRYHRHLTFPGLAQPAFLGKFLHEAGTITLRVGPMKHQPRESANPKDYKQND